MNNKPTHILKMKPKDRDSKITSTIGVAWERNGYINLALNMGVVLSWEDFQDNVVTLFPNTPYPKDSNKSQNEDPFLDDEIPF